MLIDSSNTKKTKFNATVDLLKWAKDKIKVPVVAIGGINEHNYQPLLKNGAIQPEHANLGTGEERQGNIFEDLSLRRDNFSHAIHGVNVLGHCVTIMQF